MRFDCDGFLGAVMAAEGTGGFRALINGPGGCRSRTQILVNEQFITVDDNPMKCAKSPFMSKQTRVPCTFLNNRDIVFGTADKISEGIRSVAEATGGNVVLIDTLGASVQVADRESAASKSGFGDRVVIADPDVSSLSFSAGFDDTMRRIVSFIDPKRGSSGKKKVNILGYGAFDADWTYGMQSLREFLGLMGADVSCFVGLDPADRLGDSGNADLNVMIHPECSRMTAEWYSDNLQIPFLEPSLGAPIGYDSIRSFIEEVSQALDLDPSDALNETDEDERKMMRILRNYDKFSGGLRCGGMGFEGMPSDILPVMRWMYNVFSLVPEYVCIRRTDDDRDVEGVRGFLREIDCLDALDKGPSEDLKVLFTDGLSAQYYKFDHPKMSAVGFEMPFSGVSGLVDRSLMWINGCHILLDKVINGIGSFKCGQPTGIDFR